VTPKRIRIELDEPGARALHAALTAVLATDAVRAEQAAAARGVLEQLDRRVPDWVAEDPEQAVLAALAEAEAQGRGALAEEELIAALGAGGASVRPVLDRMAKDRLIQRTERDGRIWLAAGRRRQAAADRVTEANALVDLLYAERRPGRWAHRPSVQAIGRLDDGAFERFAAELRSRGLLEPTEGDDLELTDEGAALARERWAARSPTPHWRIPAPALPYRELPIEADPADLRCPSVDCGGRLTRRSAAWKALVRDGSVEWTCPDCSRTWLLYLQAYNDVGAPAYRDPDEGNHNRPHWRAGR
jgi:Mn-dependent DtxR family transcriptional regulator